MGGQDGTHWSRTSLNLHGYVFETDEQNRFAPDGTLASLVVRGSTPLGDAAETYSVKDGVSTWTSPVDHGSRAARPGLYYTAFGGSSDALLFTIDALRKSPTHSVDLLPSGRASIASFATLDVSNGTETKTLTAYAVTGYTVSPFLVWFDGGEFFGICGVLNYLPEGWEKSAAAMNRAQDAALIKRATEQMAQYAKVPAGPVAFTNVKLYDADARKFRDRMTVVAADGRIAAEGPSAKIKVPAHAQVIDGTGKTLIPGLWDNSELFGEDATGALLLANGITSVRDQGSAPNALKPRKARIDDGRLLGPRIVPLLLIGAPGRDTPAGGRRRAQRGRRAGGRAPRQGFGLFRHHAVWRAGARVGQADDGACPSARAVCPRRHSARHASAGGGAGRL